MWTSFIRWLARDEIERITSLGAECVVGARRRQGMAMCALRDIADMETPGANATVKRMAATARKALGESQ